MEKYKPWKYYKDIFDINYLSLYENNYKVLLFDLDNTIINNRIRDVSDKEIDLFNKLKKQGFKMFIISNALPYRAKWVGSRLGVKAFGLACKPFTFTIDKIIKNYNLNKEIVVLIGDQIFTDVLGAYKAGIKSILVDPIDVYEHLITMINRGRENDIINRGDYYE